MNFGPDCKTRVSAAQSSFGSMAKMSVISPNIFPTFYQFPGRFSLTLQHIKKFGGTFFRFGKLSQVLTFDMVKDEEFCLFFIKCRLILFQKELI